jgi:hypothetical protein
LQTQLPGAEIEEVPAMTRRTRNWAIGCLLAPLLCAGAWKQDGKPAEDTTWAKTDGELAAQLVFTDKPEELFTAWKTPGPAALISETPPAVRNKSFVGVVLFGGCAVSSKGNCHATVRYRVATPDGKPYGAPQDGELWIGKAPPPKDSVQLGVGNVGIVIEAGDPLGRYTVTAKIQDMVSKKTMILERSFEAVEGEPKK